MKFSNTCDRGRFQGKYEKGKYSDVEWENKWPRDGGINRRNSVATTRSYLIVKVSKRKVFPSSNFTVVRYRLVGSTDGSEIYR